MTLPYRDVAYWDSTQASWMVENGSVQILVGGSSADADLKINKTITTCSGNAGTTQVKSVKFPGEATSLMTCPMAIVRHGASMGIAVSLASGGDYDINVFDLKGFRAGRITGKLTSGNKFPSFGQDAAPCRAVYGFRPDQWSRVLENVYGEVKYPFRENHINSDRLFINTCRCIVSTATDGKS